MDAAIGGYRRSQLWSHLVSVGLCSRMIAMRIREPEFEDMFLAGLLHDIGIVLEDQIAHNQFSQLLHGLSPDRALADQERDVFGFDHTTFGAEVAVAWGFPECVRAAIRFHHASDGCRGREARVVQCVELGKVLCTAKGHTSIATRFTADEIQTLSQDVSRRLRHHECVRFSVETRMGVRVVVGQRLGPGWDAMCLGCLLPVQAAEGGDDGPSTSEIVSRVFAWAMVRSQGENAKLKTRAKHLKSEMDIQMPVMDGYQATSKLRALGFRGPIVALSAHVTEDAIQQAKNAGCDHYMTKPIDRKRLIDLIRQCVAEHGHR